MQRDGNLCFSTRPRHVECHRASKAEPNRAHFVGIHKVQRSQLLQAEQRNPLCLGWLLQERTIRLNSCLDLCRVFVRVPAGKVVRQEDHHALSGVLARESSLVLAAAVSVRTHIHNEARPLVLVTSTTMIILVDQPADELVITIFVLVLLFNQAGLGLGLGLGFGLILCVWAGVVADASTCRCTCAHEACVYMCIRALTCLA